MPSTIKEVASIKNWRTNRFLWSLQNSQGNFLDSVIFRGGTVRGGFHNQLWYFFPDATKNTVFETSTTTTFYLPIFSKVPKFHYVPLKKLLTSIKFSKKHGFCDASEQWVRRFWADFTKKKFACGAENRLNNDNSLKIAPKALKFAIFHNKFRVLWKPEDAMKNTVFEITGYETPPMIRFLGWLGF